MRIKHILSHFRHKKNVFITSLDKKIQNKLTALQGDYGFVDIKDMPTGSYKSNKIPLANDNWATTGEFSNIADNHCGATASTNIALYFTYQEYINLLKDSSKHNTFLEIHRSIGNGPVMRIAKKTKDYFKRRGYNLRYGRAISYNGIKKAIANNRPCGVLLAAGILDWHWIIAIGWREYPDGDKYLQIINGWNNSTQKFFKLKNGARLVSATEYWIE